MEELTVPELEILITIILNILETGQFIPEAKLHSSLSDRLVSAYSKLIKVLDEGR